MIKLRFIGITGIILALCSACVTVQPPPGATPVTQPGGNTVKPLDMRRTYTVQSGDTLYKIASYFSTEVTTLAQLNQLKPPYTIYPRQVLYIDFPSPINTSQSCYPPVNWQWPTQGWPEKIVSSTGEIGVTIWGQVGQAVKATAAGRVTYNRTGTSGYLNLITLEHDNGFLSVYANNRNVWMREGEYVVPGQTIATMGTDNVGRGLLYFEIRCYGKTLDPFVFLPH